MTRSRIRPVAATLALLVGGAVLAACQESGDRAGRLTRLGPSHSPAAPGGLARFADCRSLLDEVGTAARSDPGAVDTWGWDAPGPAPAAGAREAAPGAAPPGTGAAADGSPGYSGTNNHEPGADEPDIVKTDGRRIVTVADGVLRVVDAAALRQVGSLSLPEALGVPAVGDAARLLLSGDHALVLLPGGSVADRVDGAAGPESAVALVDVAGAPRLLATYRVTGALADARQTGRAARVVVRSGVRPGHPPVGTDPAGSAAPAGVEAFLPRYTSVTAGRERTGLVPCDAVYRPARYSGRTMLTVLTFDLGAATLGDGRPVGVLGDGGTVYGTGGSLYVAGTNWWRSAPGPVPVDTPPGRPVPGPGEPVPDRPAPERTEPQTAVYRFDFSGTDAPRYVASGQVPGRLLNQYAMSEWGGDLRIATTRDGMPLLVPAPDVRSPRVTSESTVYVLRREGGRLTVTGQVGGLGRGERIYAVRFAGPAGYVVTFRQTDPLYTLDLRDPRSPRVVGELELTGYSAYLHPAGDGRLIGVGQEVTPTGRRDGTLVSLFDVADPAAPRRLARYQVPRGRSEAETDPHAFLYWPATATLVVPVTTGAGGGTAALVLGVGDTSITERGTVSHPGAGAVRRSLVVGGTLWTLSDAGLRADDLTTLAERGWLPW